ncbi:MAG: low molecular weight protein arginine phosphatase [Bacillus sp. (in: firmicutes)]
MKKILFVCTGNTCRSPIAEAILKNYQLAEVEVKSAGVYAMDGQEASTYAKEVLKDHGIPHSHHSTALSLKEIEWATYILTMTRGHAETIKDMYPTYRNKVYTLKEFVDNRSSYDVVDPYGGEKWHYQQTYAELMQLIDVLVRKLQNE